MMKKKQLYGMSVAAFLAAMSCDVWGAPPASDDEEGATAHAGRLASSGALAASQALSAAALGATSAPSMGAQRPPRAAVHVESAAAASTGRRGARKQHPPGSPEREQSVVAAAAAASSAAAGPLSPQSTAASIAEAPPQKSSVAAAEAMEKSLRMFDSNHRALRFALRALEQSLSSRKNDVSWYESAYSKSREMINFTAQMGEGDRSFGETLVRSINKFQETARVFLERNRSFAWRDCGFESRPLHPVFAQWGSYDDGKSEYSRRSGKTIASAQMSVLTGRSCTSASLQASAEYATRTGEALKFGAQFFYNQVMALKNGLKASRVKFSLGKWNEDQSAAIFAFVSPVLYALDGVWEELSLDAVAPAAAAAASSTASVAAASRDEVIVQSAAAAASSAPAHPPQVDEQALRTAVCRIGVEYGEVFKQTTLARAALQVSFNEAAKKEAIRTNFRVLVDGAIQQVTKLKGKVGVDTSQRGGLIRLVQGEMKGALEQFLMGLYGIRSENLEESLRKLQILREKLEERGQESLADRPSETALSPAVEEEGALLSPAKKPQDEAYLSSLGALLREAFEVGSQRSMGERIDHVLSRDDLSRNLRRENAFHYINLALGHVANQRLFLENCQRYANYTLSGITVLEQLLEGDGLMARFSAVKRAAAGDRRESLVQSVIEQFTTVRDDISIKDSGTARRILEKLEEYRRLYRTIKEQYGQAVRLQRHNYKVLLPWLESLRPWIEALQNVSRVDSLRKIVQEQPDAQVLREWEQLRKPLPLIDGMAPSPAVGIAAALSAAPSAAVFASNLSPHRGVAAADGSAAMPAASAHTPAIARGAIRSLSVALGAAPATGAQPGHDGDRESQDGDAAIVGDVDDAK